MSFDRLSNFVFSRMSASNLPGCSVAVIEGDEIVWSQGFGFRDLAKSRPATPRSLYNIASVTKSFTCLAIMQLAEQGKLSVNDPVSQHIPFPVETGGQPIRLWHLMTHTSGIPALGYAEALDAYLLGEGSRILPVASYTDMLAFMQNAGDWLIAAPGERQFYLNEGFVLLSYVIEKVSGMPYRDFVRQHIFEPLGMTRSLFTQAELEAHDDVATPYYPDQSGRLQPRGYQFASMGDGDIISNVHDLAQVVMMYCNRGGDLLSADSLDEMMTSRIAVPFANTPYGEMGYGYGLIIHPDFFGHRLIGHSGSVGSATADMRFIPEKKIGAVALANGTGAPLMQITRYAVTMLLGEDPDLALDLQQEKALDELSGTYHAYHPTVTMEVSRKGAFLMLKDTWGTTTVLIPDDWTGSRRRFYTLLSGGQILEAEFHVKKDGGIDLFFERFLYRK